MINELLSILMCSKCGSQKLSLIQFRNNKSLIKKIKCLKCEAEYEIKNDIPVFIDEEEVLNSDKVRVFHNHADRYDSWFFSEKGRILFKNELNALKTLLRGVKIGKALEIGVGTGEFAYKLNIKYGIDPALNALLKAKDRGITCVQGIAEKLPFKENTFDSVFLIVTICYVSDVNKTINEAFRVLKNNGLIVIGFINRDSQWGRLYIEKKRKGHLFYGPAHFYSFKEVEELLTRNGFRVIKIVTTLYQSPLDTPKFEDPVEGIRENAGFITILARKVISNDCQGNQSKNSIKQE